MTTPPSLDVIPYESPARVAPVGPQHRLPTLDGVRGFAILFVMIFHMSVIGFTDRPDRPWVDRAWLGFAMFGWTGVDLFFVLSGLLITGILLDAKPDATVPGVGRRRYFTSFYARRVLRVFPLYYGIVAFSLLVLPHVPNARAERFGSIRGDGVWYWTLLANWSIGLRAAFRHGILDVTWSLAIEEQFYLVWPAVVLLLGRRSLGWLCAALSSVSIATRTALLLHGFGFITVLALTPCRMDGLALGALLALMARRPGGLAAARPLLFWVGGLVGAPLLAFLFVVGPDWTRSFAGMSIGFSAVAVCYACLVGLAATASPRSWLGRFFDAYPLRQLGRLSYALYLFHSPLRGLLRDTLFRPDRFPALAGSQLPGQFLFYIVAIAISLAAAWSSWHLIEKRVLAMKRFFPMPVGSPAH